MSKDIIRIERHILVVEFLIPGIPGSLGRFDLKNGGVGQMKKGAVTGSISQIETRLRLSPAVDSSQPT